MSKQVKVGIVGAAGYLGEVLIHLLANHPQVTLGMVTSRQHVGKPVNEVVTSMRGQLEGLSFVNSDPEELASSKEIDLFFLALPHGAAAIFAESLAAAGKKVIDLSADFRISDPVVYEEFYGAPHPNTDLLAKSRYVMPELVEPGWESAAVLACPGCYPTSIQIPLVPLVRAGLIDSGRIVINSFSGVSGAGKKMAEDFLFCERSESAKAYGLPKHRHLSEIEEQLSEAAGQPVVVQFNPHLAPMRRGIATTITVLAKDSSIEALYAKWEEAYNGKPFVSILPSGEMPDTKDVVGSNRVEMSAVYDPRTGNFVITSAEDNLMKGGSGQAVQIMNLLLGFSETAGLLS